MTRVIIKHLYKSELDHDGSNKFSAGERRTVKKSRDSHRRLMPTRRMAALLGVRRWSRLHFSKSFLRIGLIFFVIFVNALKSYSQEGFLSIDCGNTGANYNDSNGLQWLADDGSYIKTGSRSGQVFPESNAIGTNEALRSYRFFPERRNKYCYELPTFDEFCLLLRASFYMNESVLHAARPFEFILSINGNDWFTVNSGNDSLTSLLIVQEGIFYPTYTNDVENPIVYFCLRPVIGVPFISALEVRSGLEGTMYDYNSYTTQYLNLISRYNTGAISTAPDVRYPADIYDRIWKTPDKSLDVLPSISGPGAPSYLSDLGIQLNFVPLQVMQDAWLFTPISMAAFPTYDFGPELNPSRGEYLFVVVYSADLNTTASKFENGIQCFIQDDYSSFSSFGSFNSSTVNMMQFPFFFTSSSFINVSFELCQESLNSTNVFDETCLGGDGRLASMNAVEIYGQYEFNFSMTNPDDDQFVTALKTVFALTDWQGDPCVPMPHDWLSCTLTLLHRNPIYYVTSVNISNSEISDDTNVTTSSSSLSSLNELSITSSGVHDLTFELFVNYSTPVLSLLNLSGNALTYLPASWVTTTKRLVVLDLSHNQLDGQVSSLDTFIQGNSLSLQELYIHDNNFGGTFSSALYFSSLPNLTIANFDRNSIQGTLDLSAWYLSLERISKNTRNKTVTPASIPQLFSFANNNISKIIPNVESFESTVQHLLVQDKLHGILLGGNPYCKNAKSYIQRYLCRSTVNDVVKEETNNRDKILIISITCGAILLLLCFALLITLWRLWKQVFTLREIQKALIDRKVQPPIYHYNDLKAATKYFHHDNKLGIGGFGVVYKGILMDQTPIAVKKLFDSQSMQVLDDFLNEVMLITGIKHRNLIQLKGCCMKDKQRILVYEYAEKGNLAEALWGSKAHETMSWELRFNICLGVARGLSYLHEELQPSIIHRDIKPENILLDKDFKPKIADFGLARHIFGEESHILYTQASKVAGTRGYLAPEYALHGQLSDKADVYSYGILVLEVVCGRKGIDFALPVEEKVLKDWVRKMRTNGSILDVLQPELRDNCVESEVIPAINIGLLCTQYAPEMRPSMSQVVAMFLGRMNIQILDEFEQIHSSAFKDLLGAVNQNVDYPRLEPIEEDLTALPLLERDAQSSLINTSLGTSSLASQVVELSRVL